MNTNTKRLPVHITHILVVTTPRFFQRVISEILRPITAKLCHFNFITQVKKFRGLSPPPQKKKSGAQNMQNFGRFYTISQLWVGVFFWTQCTFREMGIWYFKHQIPNTFNVLTLKSLRYQLAWQVMQTILGCNHQHHIMDRCCVSVCLSVCLSVISLSGAFRPTRTWPLTLLLASMGHDGVTPCPPHQPHPFN